MFDMFLYYKKDKKKKQPTKKTGVDCWEVFDTHKSPPPNFFSNLNCIILFQTY